MTEVSVRDLRNHGGDVLSQVERGLTVVVTKSGKPVAELRPIASQGTPAEFLLERWKNLPHVGLESLRRDIDAVIDPSL